MAKNLGREYATMDEDERRRFAMEAEGGTDAAPEELEFEDPREQRADDDDRDGASAVLDEEAHRRAVARRGKK
jgi:hypothetical protein